jgi:hypothetical protein
MKSLVLTILLLSCVSIQAQRTALLGRQIEMKVVNVADLSSQPWPKGDFVLVTTEVDTTNLRVLKALDNNRILADKQALAVVYELNPEVTDLKHLPPGNLLKLPKIAGKGLPALIQKGELIELTMDPDLRHAISDTSINLKQFTPLDPKLTSDDATRGELNELITWYGQIGPRFMDRTDPPLSHETLVEISREGMILNKTLADASRQKSELSPEDREQIHAFHQDMGIVKDRFNETLAPDIPDAQNKFTIEVSIQPQDDLSRFKNLRVYYECHGLFLTEKPRQSVSETGQAGSDLAKIVSMPLEKKYLDFWLAPDGDPNQLLSSPVLVPANASSPYAITLILKTGAQR